MKPPRLRMSFEDSCENFRAQRSGLRVQRLESGKTLVFGSWFLVQSSTLA
jgi:hypothetical protein